MQHLLPSLKLFCICMYLIAIWQNSFTEDVLGKLSNTPHKTIVFQKTDLYKNLFHFYMHMMKV